MTLRWLVAALHLIALGIGLGAVWARGRALRGSLDPTGLRRAFAADNWWAVAALLWVGTGIPRAFAGLEKGTAYYVSQPVFWIKMTLFGLVFLLELRPMLTLMRWRRQVAKGQTVDTAPAAALATISGVQTGLLVLIVLAATAMARGLRP